MSRIGYRRVLGDADFETAIHRDKWGVDIATWTPPDPEAVVAVDGDASEEEAEEAALAQMAARDVAQLSREERRERVDEVRRKLEALGYI